MSEIDEQEIIDLVNQAIADNPAFADLTAEVARAETAANEAAASALTAGSSATDARDLGDGGSRFRHAFQRQRHHSGQ